ncbi:MAG: hypothetical protein U0992_24415 [Planctomycetaceae bacterium]
MSSRHTILKRVAAWTAGVLLLLTAYVLGAHLCYSTIGRRIPASAPIVAGLYAPLSVYSRHPDWPGSRLYVRYVIWSDREFANHFILTADPRKVLDEQTDVVFHGTSLHDVITYLREVHSCRIEFDPDVDTEQEITIVQQGTVRDVTQSLLTPLGLAAAADRERILIGTPAALERAAAESRRSNSILYFTLAVLVVLTAVTVVWWSRRNHKRPAA